PEKRDRNGSCATTPPERRSRPARPAAARGARSGRDGAAPPGTRGRRPGGRGPRPALGRAGTATADGVGWFGSSWLFPVELGGEHAQQFLPGLEDTPAG